MGKQGESRLIATLGVCCLLSLTLILLLPAIATTLGPLLYRRITPAASAAEEELLSWVQSGGGTTQVAVGRNRQGLRGLIATSHLGAGAVILAIPVSQCIPIPLKDSSAPELALALARERLNVQSNYLPYIKTLPQGADSAVVSYDTIPVQYHPLIQSDAIVQYINNIQSHLAHFWASNGIDLANKGIDHHLLKQSLALITSRFFSFQKGNATVYYLVPVLDMGNHHNGCTNTYQLEQCPGKPAARCVVFRAGDAIRQGGEVCSYYGYLTPDKALLNYGFLIDNKPGELHGIDYPDFAYEQLYKAKHTSAPAPFTGTLDELNAETKRLQQLLAGLQSYNDVVEAGWPKSEEDPSGQMLDLIQQWRLMRQAAIQAELQRLNGLMQSVSEGSCKTEQRDVASSAKQRMQADLLYSGASAATWHSAL
eukprot:jgi/Chrzof1/2684/Cz11g25040.t1